MEKKHAPDAKLAKFTIVEVTLFYYLKKLLIQFLWEDSYGNETKEKEKIGYEK